MQFSYYLRSFFIYIIRICLIFI